MANNYKHKRTVSDVIRVKGYVLNADDETYIEYENGNEELTVSVLDLFNQFLNEEVSVTISTKEETDLDE